MNEPAAFRLDPANQCLWRCTDSGEDERILLTRTEFGVLDHLVAHAGRLVTHRELLDAVWPRTAIEPQAVKSKIFRLRRALGDDPKQPRYIETMSRRGYRFVGNIERGGAEHASAPPPTGLLVGRVGALAELSQCIRDATAGRLQIVFVTGEPGIGKTALTEEFQRQVAAPARTVRVACGQCVEGFGSKEAFYPVLEAVGELCRGPDGTPLVDILASHAPTWLVQFPALLTREHREMLRQEILGATRERMLREICQALEAIARPTPLLLVLEDLHWADPSTLDLISALARHRRSARLMLVATYRPTDVARSAQPLHSLKRELVARHLCREIVLQPLDAGEIGEYLAQSAATPTAPADVPEELASMLHRHTEGNALFMIAVLEHLVERGLVARDHGAWWLRRPAADIALEVPESLRDMIGAQIERLAEPEQRVLEVAAIAGMSFAPAICAPSADLDATAFDECCDSLARRGHILRLADARQLPDGMVVQRYSFVHALYRQVLYERQTPARRAALHRQRGQRLEAVFASTLDDVALELAHHYEQGADWARAVKYLRRAADAAARRFSFEGARANLQHALALAGRLPAAERAAVEIELLYSLAGIQLATLDSRAVDSLTVVREKAAEHGLVDVEVKALVDLAYPLAWVSSERSVEVIDQALRLSDAQRDPLTRAQTRARCMVRRIMARGWDAEDAEESGRALAEIRRLGTREDVAWHQIDSGFLAVTSSQYRQVRRDLVDSLTILGNVHDESIPLGYVAAHRLREYVVPWGQTLVGEWGAALREFGDSIALAERNGDPFGSGVLRLLRCWLQLFAKDFGGALDVCESILAAPRQPGGMFGRHLCITLAGVAEAGLGNNERALEHLLAARREMDQHVALLDWYSRLWQRWALTNVWLSTGDLARAREEGEQFVADAGATAERTWQALAWETSARIALASGDSRAQVFVGNALAAIEGVEAPVAAWQAHATAAEAARARGDTAATAHHREMSRGVVLGLAASLGPDQEALRRTFLSAPQVASVLGESPIAASSLEHRDRAPA